MTEVQIILLKQESLEYAKKITKWIAGGASEHVGQLADEHLNNIELILAGTTPEKEKENE